MTENQIGNAIVGAAIEVHKQLGPGLLETTYEIALMHELSGRGLTVKRQVSIPIQYRGVQLEEGFRADMIVGDKVMLELKSVESINDIHKKQLLTYLKLAGMKLGYLMNFGESLMKKGITRIVNGLEENK
jgi:GxxExxY protein